MLINASYKVANVLVGVTPEQCDGLVTDGVLSILVKYLKRARGTGQNFMDVYQVASFIVLEVILQGGRNFVGMMLFSEMLTGKIQFTETMYAYSMLYPLVVLPFLSILILKRPTISWTVLRFRPKKKLFSTWNSKSA